MYGRLYISRTISINPRIRNSVVLVSHRTTSLKHKSWFSGGRKNLITDPYLPQFWKPEGYVLNEKVPKTNEKAHYTHLFERHRSSRHCNVACHAGIDYSTPVFRLCDISWNRYCIFGMCREKWYSPQTSFSFRIEIDD